MSAHALAGHMERPVGRGRVPLHAHTGAAGGAACGDLVRISLAIDPASAEGRVAEAGFDARGCGAAVAAGSAAVALVRGAPLLRAARVGADQIAAELGGLSAAKLHAAELAADALHRALGGAARARAALAPHPARALVAMSGGVDSAVAALLTARGGQEAGGQEAAAPESAAQEGAAQEVVAVTLELWSDPHNDGERSC
ncbi:MAG: iron-sulfur cluster assembly scaffold protein, partial [Solirubrobacterales bacterium]|nr:iron-sulfur cluster assembly scaffold protein [Solirubrobacterales bacterium]